MSKYKFVGFQEHVEIPAGFEELKIDIEFSSPLGYEAAFNIVSNRDEIAQWFFPVVAFDSKQGGKATFNTGSETFDAVVTSFVLGKEVSWVSDQFGRFVIRISKNGKASEIRAECTILTDNADQKVVEVEAIFSRLKVLAQR